MDLILASGSPRRRELLAEAGYCFRVLPADVDESDFPAGTAPADLAELLGRRKAAAVAAQHPHAVVLAADTVVGLGPMILGKPADRAAAVEMLSRLSGSTHTVITGVCVQQADRGYLRSLRVVSQVQMRPMSSVQIHDYIATGQWQGKAGGYGIQDQGEDPFVVRLSGSHTNIVGLPMEETAALLAEAGIGPTAAK